MNRLITLSSLLGSSMLVRAVGNAIVTNKCDYQVYLQAVPAANEGYDAIVPAPLQPGASWSQQWTGLGGSHDGWSIKLSKTEQLSEDAILQYEYTYQPTVNADILWLDLSSVNGINNPWLSEGWDIATSENCTDALKQGVSYMYSTNDHVAMQPQCPADADITVTLCDKGAGWALGNWNTASGKLGALQTGAAEAVSSLVAAATSDVASFVAAAVVPSSIATTLTTAPATTASAAPTFAPVAPAAVENNFGSSSDSTGPVQDSAVEGPAFADKAVAPHSFAHTVTEITTAWVTSFTTVDFPAPTEEVHKRHAHHAGHHHA